MSTSAQRMMVHRLKSHRQSAKMQAFRDRMEAKRNGFGGPIGSSAPPSRVLEDWHVDKDGCPVRSVGREA